MALAFQFGVNCGNPSVLGDTALAEELGLTGPPVVIEVLSFDEVVVPPLTLCLLLWPVGLGIGTELKELECDTGGVLLSARGLSASDVSWLAGSLPTE
jgi:hypothetical protein